MESIIKLCRNIYSLGLVSRGGGFFVGESRIVGVGRDLLLLVLSLISLFILWLGWISFVFFLVELNCI